MKVNGSFRLYLCVFAIFAVTVTPVLADSLLLNIGRSAADGGWYGGRTPASPDANGNYWNILDPGMYAANMRTQSNASTLIGAGFINTNNPVMTWWNGPAGDNSAPWSINNAALGALGNTDAAFDYVWGTNIRMSIDGLTVGQIYDFAFFSSRRWEGDATTTISIHSSNAFDSGSLLSTGTVANRDAVNGWVHNSDTLLQLNNLTATSSSMYINIVGGSGGHGALNSMSITAVPEPSAASLLVLGTVALLAMRRRR